MKFLWDLTDNNKVFVQQDLHLKVNGQLINFIYNGLRHARFKGPPVFFIFRSIESGVIEACREERN